MYMYVFLQEGFNMVCVHIFKRESMHIHVHVQLHVHVHEHVYDHVPE